jgi:predicted dehydrogenase
LGGGLLNNIFTHKLGQVLHLTGGKVTAVVGEARRLLERAPVGAAIHDIRIIFEQLVESDETTEWCEVNADMAYTITVQMEMPDGGMVGALFKGSVMAVGRNSEYLAFYGEHGTLHLNDSHAPDRLEHFDHRVGEWRILQVPSQIMMSLPQVNNLEQRDWNQLFHEFVADVQGEGNARYPTFHEGWLHNEIIDIVRSGRGWTSIPAKPRP